MAFRQDEHRVSRSCESGCARYRVKRVLWLVPLIRVMQSKDGKLSAVGEVLQRWQRPIIRLIGGVVLTTLRADLSKNVDYYQTGMLDAVAPFFDSFGAAVVKTSAASTWHSKHFGIDSKPPLGKGPLFFFSNCTLHRRRFSWRRSRQKVAKNLRLSTVRQHLASRARPRAPQFTNTGGDLKAYMLAELNRAVDHAVEDRG